MISDGQIIITDAVAQVVWVFDADDCEAIAATLPSDDMWADQLMASARLLRMMA